MKAFNGKVDINEESFLELIHQNIDYIIEYIFTDRDEPEFASREIIKKSVYIFNSKEDMILHTQHKTEDSHKFLLTDLSGIYECSKENGVVTRGGLSVHDVISQIDDHIDILKSRKDYFIKKINESNLN